MIGIGVSGGDVMDLFNLDVDPSTAPHDPLTFIGVMTTAEDIAAGLGALWVMDVGVGWTGDAGARIRIYANLDDDSGPDLEIRMRDPDVVAADFYAGDFLL